MQPRHYLIRFLTPAFLGNASQQAQWRTPPIKALLRQWWRVVWMSDNGFPTAIEPMRTEEAHLFGHAWLRNDPITTDAGIRYTDAQKSAVRLRLLAPPTLPALSTDAWAQGTQRGIAPLSNSPENNYAWFGLINRTGGLADRNAIKADAPESARELWMAAPESAQGQLDAVMRLINAFGAAGSRNRGGWGSLHVAQATTLSVSELTPYTQPLERCLQRDWAAALARDARGLCLWHSHKTFQTWDAAMAFIARARRSTRTALSTELRIALGFSGSGRMPSPLRWKVIPAADALRVRVFAMPHAIPQESGDSLSKTQLAAAWNATCTALDLENGLHRIESE